MIHQRRRPYAPAFMFPRTGEVMVTVERVPLRPLPCLPVPQRQTVQRGGRVQERFGSNCNAVIPQSNG